MPGRFCSKYQSDLAGAASASVVESSYRSKLIGMAGHLAAGAKTSIKSSAASVTPLPLNSLFIAGQCNKIGP
jgi:hypothetical protein